MAHAIQPHLSSLLTASCQVTRSFGAPDPAFCKAADLTTTFPPQQHHDIDILGMLWYVRYVSQSHVANVFACMRIHTASSQLLPLPNAPQCTPPFDATRPQEQKLSKWPRSKAEFLAGTEIRPMELLYARHHSMPWKSPRSLSQQILLRMKSTCMNASSSTVTNIMWSPGAAFSVCFSVLLSLSLSLVFSS